MTRVENRECDDPSSSSRPEKHAGKLVFESGINGTLEYLQSHSQAASGAAAFRLP